MKLTPPFQLLACFVRAYRRRAARRTMEGLSDHLLRDIGIERRDIPFVVAGLTRPAKCRTGAAGAPRHIPVFGPRLHGRVRG